jgi:2-methylcitrate dehydratase PrpD
VLGSGGPAAWPIERAGRLALAAHLRDRDDIHLATLVHPGGVVWAAAVACGLERGAELGETITAAAFGYELTVRVAAAYAPEHGRRWHGTATAGVVGAAGAAARVLGARPVDAVGHALSVAGGSIEAILELSGTRVFHRAHAATTAVACARAAATGLGATRLGLGRGRGTFADEPSDELLAARPATALEETDFRLHPATGFAHAAMEAAAALGPVDAAAVRRVVATVSPPVALAIASNPEPLGGERAWWSIEHAIAGALVSGDPDVVADDPELRSRVELVAGAPGWAATVEITLADGTAGVRTVERPRAATADDLLRKWREVLEPELLERLLDGDEKTPLAEVLPELPA